VFAQATKFLRCEFETPRGPPSVACRRSQDSRCGKRVQAPSTNRVKQELERTRRHFRRVRDFSSHSIIEPLPLGRRMVHILPLSVLSFGAGVIAISAPNLDAPLKVLSGNSYGILIFEPTFRSAVALRTVSGTLNGHRAVVIRTRLSRSRVRAENPSNPLSQWRKQIRT
jgi:hypothetical protein